jgi:hypothetical protein
MIEALFYTVVAFWGLMMVAVAILSYLEPKPKKKKNMDWSCGTMDWMACTQHPFDEEGQCTYCGKS